MSECEGVKDSMLFWKEGKKSGSKNKHNLMTEKLSVSNVPSSIKEPTVVQGGVGCCVSSCPGGPTSAPSLSQALSEPGSCGPSSPFRAPRYRNWGQCCGASTPAPAGFPLALKKLMNKSSEKGLNRFPASQPRARPS